MAAVIVQHHVEDFDRWYPVFEEHGEVRRSHGGTGHALYRTADDPNEVIIVNEFASIDGARAFLQDPTLKEAMGRAGVDSDPRIWVVDEARSERY
jgi:uncharacterized protein (DUF1330 family)